MYVLYESRELARMNQFSWEAISRLDLHLIMTGSKFWAKSHVIETQELEEICMNQWIPGFPAIPAIRLSARSPWKPTTTSRMQRALFLSLPQIKRALHVGSCGRFPW